MSRTNERSILSVSIGRCLQVGQARVAGAEIVHRQRDAERLQALQRRDRGLGVVHHHALGELDLEVRGSRPVSARMRDTARTRPSCRNWRAERLTDTTTGGRPCFCQARSAGRPRRSTHSPICTMRPVSSASGMKRSGAHQAPLRMLPAQQRLRADDRAGLRGPPSAGSAAANSLRSSARRRLCSSARRSLTSSFISAVKNWKLLRPVLLGAVHRDVGVLQQRVDVGRRPAGSRLMPALQVT